MSTITEHEVETRRIALFGTFDTDNFGDCLFPLIVEQQLSGRMKVELMLFSPTSRKVKTADYSRVHAFHELGDLFHGSTPAIIIGGGALLATEHVLFAYPQMRRLYPYSLKCWLLPAMIAVAQKCPFILNAVGFGPFDDEFKEMASKYLQRADLCAVRDLRSQAMLSEMDVDSRIVPDIGILTPELRTDEEWGDIYDGISAEFDMPARYIAVQASLYLESRLKPFADAVARAAKRENLPVVLVPLCHHLNDLVALRIMAGRFKAHGVETVMIDRVLSALETSSVLSKAAIFAGTSLHGALVSFSFGNPVLSFSLKTMDKNRVTLSALGMENCLENDPDQVDSRISETLHTPPARRDAALHYATSELATYFDRMSDVIRAKSGMPMENVAQMSVSADRVQCEGIEDDLETVKRLCLRRKGNASLLRRCAACIIRNNRLSSEYYDRMLFWLKVGHAS